MSAQEATLPRAASTGGLPFVSVIIPVFNDTERLRLCLDALERQTYPAERFEVIVVDNGSDDDITQVVGREGHVRVARENRRGSYAARNTGLELAGGDVIAFTDSDCVPAGNWIANGVEHLEADPDCGLVGGRIDIFYANAQRPNAFELYDMVRGFPQRKWIELEHYGATANVITRRSVLERVGPFDAALKSSGDREWGRRVHAAGYRLVYADDVVIGHPARASFDEAHQKMLRVVGGFRDYYSRSKQVRGLVRDALPPVSEALAIVRDRRLVNWQQRLKVLYVLLRLRWLRVWLRLRVLAGLPIGAGR